MYLLISKNSGLGSKNKSILLCIMLFSFDLQKNPLAFYEQRNWTCAAAQQ